MRIETWRAGLGAGRAQPLANRTRNRMLTILGGIMERAHKVYGLPSNPVRDVDFQRSAIRARELASPSARIARPLAAAFRGASGRERGEPGQNDRQLTSWTHSPN
jgi:hypothetical protein